ncbi:hypothetical protein AVEN_216853-1 [Araneus ventricosus]|uniref:Uncharacterized protein n=1 Tax=Araneus ventricosus TaxID=182803 RepID=A0A4Y2THN2_ARAVE|nr:hypothetical protein AVEN_216853-1 [Araneus ventricosus]
MPKPNRSRTAKRNSVVILNSRKASPTKNRKHSTAPEEPLMRTDETSKQPQEIQKKDQMLPVPACGSEKLIPMLIGSQETRFD